jgi:hypothetical protein
MDVSTIQKELCILTASTPNMLMSREYWSDRLLLIAHEQVMYTKRMKSITITSQNSAHSSQLSATP